MSEGEGGVVSDGEVAGGQGDEVVMKQTRVEVVGENDRVVMSEGEGGVVGDDEIQRINNTESGRSIQEIVTNVMLEQSRGIYC